MQRQLNHIKILVTGANGLIGRLIAKSLQKKGYTLYGLDRLPEGHATSRFEMEKNEKSAILKTSYVGKYFIADITKIEELKKVMSMVGKVDMIIHLAAALEDAEPHIIREVNEHGTENIFRICEEYHIKKVLLASSMMVLWDKYTMENPYCLIKKNNYQGQTKDIPKITEDESWSLSPIGETLSVATYKNSKIISEMIARRYVDKDISSISMRVGSVNTLNKPPKEHIWAWTHHDDLGNFAELAAQYLLNNKKAESVPLFLCSDNKLCIVSLKKAKEVLGYVPRYGTHKIQNIQWSFPQKSIDLPEIKEKLQLAKIKSKL